MDALIAQQRSKIDKLREKVKDFVPQNDPEYDDLFYLRCEFLSTFRVRWKAASLHALAVCGDADDLAPSRT